MPEGIIPGFVADMAQLRRRLDSVAANQGPDSLRRHLDFMAMEIEAMRLHFHYHPEGQTRSPFQTHERPKAAGKEAL